jgi:hypothetical protein
MHPFTSLKLFLLASLFLTFSLQAKIITVEYGAGTAGQYHDLQTAHDAANSGDTIYVFPAFAAYAGITVSKKLTIIGTGFQAPDHGLPTTLISGTMDFQSGADGANLTGFGGEFTVYINSNNILIKRNLLKKIVIGSGGNKSIVILQNFIIDNGVNNYLIDIGDYSSVLIANNFIYNSSDGCYWINCGLPTITINMINNIFGGGSGNYSSPSIAAQGANSNIANNIIVNGAYCSGNGYYNNIATGSPIPSGNGNVLSVNVDALFENYIQNDFHLKSNSPAKGAGLNGVDCGIYGGSMPFVDGGAPGLPLITKFDSDLSGSKQNGLNVHVKAKSVRE